MNVIRRFAIGLLLGCVCCTQVWAMDFSRMTNQELADLRGAIHNATQEEQSAFRQEWEKRVAAMPPEEKKLYTGQEKISPGEEEKAILPYHIMGQGYENQGAGNIFYGDRETFAPEGQQDAGR